MNPFDFVNSITYDKNDLMDEPYQESVYDPYLVNRALSQHEDTVYLANEMNQYHNLDKKMQYHFLLNTVRKRKRYGKWAKKVDDEMVEYVSAYYGYGPKKAQQAVLLLSDEQLELIKNKIKEVSNE